MILTKKSFWFLSLYHFLFSFWIRYVPCCYCCYCILLFHFEQIGNFWGILKTLRKLNNRNGNNVLLLQNSRLNLHSVVDVFLGILPLWFCTINFAPMENWFFKKITYLLVSWEHSWPFLVSMVELHPLICGVVRVVLVHLWEWKKYDIKHYFERIIR